MLDIIFLIFAALYFYKGYKIGFILAVFKLFAYMLGIIIAMQFSATLSAYLFTDSDSLFGRLFPLLSYIILFSATVYAVNMLGRVVQKAFNLPILGLANRLLGGVVYLLLICLIASTFIWLAEKAQLLNADVATTSLTYGYIQPLAPYAFQYIGVIVPFVKDIFGDLRSFFQTLPTPKP